MRDATGTDVPRGDYRRIVVLDGLDIVLSLVLATRVVAIDEWAATHSLEPWRVADRPRLSTSPAIEKIMAANPDLVFTGSFGNPETHERIASLRSLGVAVFDLAYVIDGDDLLNQIASIGAILNVPKRGEIVRGQIARRLQLTRLPLPASMPRRRATMLCAAGDYLTLFGPNDVFGSAMTGAGVVNAAAAGGEHFASFASLERVLKIDPDVLIIRPRNRRAIYELPRPRHAHGGRHARPRRRDSRTLSRHRGPPRFRGHCRSAAGSNLQPRAPREIP